jgi:hypothetical protein
MKTRKNEAANCIKVENAGVISGGDLKTFQLTRERIADDENGINSNLLNRDTLRTALVPISIELILHDMCGMPMIHISANVNSTSSRRTDWLSGYKFFVHDVDCCIQ